MQMTAISRALPTEVVRPSSGHITPGRTACRDPPPDRAGTYSAHEVPEATRHPGGPRAGRAPGAGGGPRGGSHRRRGRVGTPGPGVRPRRRHRAHRPAHRGLGQRPRRPAPRPRGRPPGQAARDGLGRPGDGRVRGRLRDLAGHPALDRQRHRSRAGPPRRGRRRLDRCVVAPAHLALVAALGDLVRPLPRVLVVRRLGRRPARGAADPRRHRPRGRCSASACTCSSPCPTWSRTRPRGCSTFPCGSRCASALRACWWSPALSRRWSPPRSSRQR